MCKLIIHTLSVDRLSTPTLLTAVVISFQDVLFVAQHSFILFFLRKGSALNVPGYRKV